MRLKPSYVKVSRPDSTAVVASLSRSSRRHCRRAAGSTTRRWAAAYRAAFGLRWAAPTPSLRCGSIAPPSRPTVAQTALACGLPLGIDVGVHRVRPRAATSPASRDQPASRQPTARDGSAASASVLGWTGSRQTKGVANDVNVGTLGTFSVSDHLRSAPFAADVLLFDCLAIPTVTQDDVDRWTQIGRRPDLQSQTVAVLRDPSGRRAARDPVGSGQASVLPRQLSGPANAEHAVTHGCAQVRRGQRQHQATREPELRWIAPDPALPAGRTRRRQRPEAHRWRAASKDRCGRRIRFASPDDHRDRPARQGERLQRRRFATARRLHMAVLGARQRQHASRHAEAMCRTRQHRTRRRLPQGVPRVPWTRMRAEQTPADAAADLRERIDRSRQDARAEATRRREASVRLHDARRRARGPILGLVGLATSGGVAGIVSSGTAVGRARVRRHPPSVSPEAASEQDVGAQFWRLQRKLAA